MLRIAVATLNDQIKLKCSSDGDYINLVLSPKSPSFVLQSTVLRCRLHHFQKWGGNESHGGFNLAQVT